ncbi:hypothetical protein OF83DRAFT_1084337 [Amylostereum chailletii]|nr:hypothetical protein OF83DRAFT_1084337 [Amylostereum chailletii]
MPSRSTATVSKKTKTVTRTRGSRSKKSTTNVITRTQKMAPAPSRKARIQQQQDQLTDEEVKILLPLYVLDPMPSDKVKEKVKNLMLERRHRTFKKIDNWFSNRRKKYNHPVMIARGFKPVLLVRSKPSLSVDVEKGVAHLPPPRRMRYLKEEIEWSALNPLRPAPFAATGFNVPSPATTQLDFEVEYVQAKVDRKALDLHDAQEAAEVLAAFWPLLSPS